MITNDISNSWVIDQGFFRNQDLSNRIKSSSNNEFFIVTEDALIEMFKSKDWKYISKLSLSIIKDYKEKILVSFPIGVLREKEVESKQACRSFIDVDSTKLFRDLLDEYQRDIEGEMVRIMQENISKTQSYKSSKVLDHKKNKNLYLSIVSQFQDQMGPTLRKELRKNRVQFDIIYQIILEGVDECFRYPDGEFNILTNDELQNFINSKPVYFFLYAALLYKAFYWQKKLGLEQMKLAKITNYILDTNYIVIAMYAKGILSTDGFVNDMYRHLKKIEKARFGKR
jgi:hypothetical protein